MTTIEQVVYQARDLLTAGLTTEVSTLAVAYNPGDPTITLRHDRRIPEGSAISVGLTTLVCAASTSGKEVAVVSTVDGSPDQSAPPGTPVLLRPLHTTWQVFNEVANVISDISSPRWGLYAVHSVSMPTDTTDGTYPVPANARRIIRVRYLEPGDLDVWRDMSWVFQPSAASGPVVRTTSFAPGGSTVQVIYGGDFTPPERLTDTLDSLGMPDSYARLLAVGAAGTLSLTTESRRGQPFAQGDSRRAEEVPITAHLSVYDRLRRDFRDLVASERVRLVQQFPYRHQMEQYQGAIS